MYDDKFNPLGIQGRGVHPPNEQNFFATSNPTQRTKFCFHFQVKTSHPFSFLQCSNESF